VEIFKSAFLTAFNIYDKVAFFLNYYEELGIEDKDVSFWDGNSIFTIKGDLLKKEEYSKNLVALYTIKKEIEKNEFTKIKEIRNLITHRYLVLHDIGCFENSNYHMDIHEFFKSTLYMLLQIKNILFSIVSFILEKEDLNKKKGRKKWRRIPTLELEQNWENDDETTKIVDEITEELNKAIDKLASSIFEVVNKK
jgi:hypothetical protein